MDIGINDNAELEFSFYLSCGDLKLSIEEMKEITKVGSEFLPNATADKESFEKFMRNRK